MNHPNVQATDNRPIIKCESVYKIFGENSKRMLQQVNGQVDTKQFQAAGLVVGVNNASFEVSKGELLVIMGLSGSGKSTLLRCISRLSEPTSGQIFIDGEDLVGMSPRKLIELRRNKMGMVFQNFALLPHKTVLENIAFPLQVKGQTTADSIKRALEMVELVGLAGRENYFTRELSGGQQQRVGIARSLAVEPDIWFLDEPFSALDPLIRKQMQDEFLRIQAKLKKSIVFITHDFHEALRLADRMAIMRDGAIVQIGRPVDLILNPVDDYIREFTLEVPWETILTAADIAEPSDEPLEGLGRVSHDTLIEKLLHYLGESNKGVVVEAKDGSVLGVATARGVVKALSAGSDPDQNPVKI